MQLFKQSSVRDNYRIRTGRDACAERCSVSCALPVGHHDFEILHWKFVLTIVSHKEQDQGDSGQLLGRL